MSRSLIEPFTLIVSDAQIEDLRLRLSRTRWPAQLPDAGWDYGTELLFLQRLCEYWETSYDWNCFRTRLNAHHQFITTIDDERVYFYHLRSPEPDARPLLITHGWPGSVVDFLELLARLADPVAHGGRAEDAFHVVAPSIPEFGASGPTRRRGMNRPRIARMLGALMRHLGYERFYAQGGDWGALISSYLAHSEPDRVAALHINLAAATAPDPAKPLQGLDAHEIADLARVQEFHARESAYTTIQSTKPQSLGYGLTDSPAGLAAWIIEKFVGWSDCGIDLERDFSRDALLDNISLYWMTGTIASSCRLYAEENPSGKPFDFVKVTVPTGIARFAGEPFAYPRRWVEATYDVRYWAEYPKGRHFAAMQVPEVFLDDGRTFFGQMRRAGIG